MQLQQHRSNQMLVLLAAIIDPTEENESHANQPGGPPRSEFVRTAALTGDAILFLTLMCGLAIMIAGIARQTNALWE